MLKTAVIIVIPHYNRYLHSPSILQSTIRGVSSPIIFNDRPCSKVILAAAGGVALVTNTLSCRAGQEVHTSTAHSLSKQSTYCLYTKLYEAVKLYFDSNSPKQHNSMLQKSSLKLPVFRYALSEDCKIKFCHFRT